MSAVVSEWQSRSLSPELAGVMFTGPAEKMAHRVAHTLLVELLAFQFASPVRWIETQRILFAEVCLCGLVLFDCLFIRTHVIVN